MQASSLPRPLAVAAIAIYFLFSTDVTHAQNSWWMHNCENCFTGEQFRAAAIQHAKMQIAAGTYLTVSGNNSRSAFVKVTGNVVNVCPATEPCYQELRNVTGTIVDSQGIPIGGGAGEGASLEYIDQQLFGTLRSDPIAQVTIPSDYGGSFINNDALDADTSTAIMRVLTIDRGISPLSPSIKPGTIVTVVWADGTKAQFIRQSATATYQWKYVEGSARNANGQPIDRQGRVIGATPSGTGSGGSVNYATSNGSSYVMASEAGFCLSRQRFFYNGQLYGEWVGIVRCN
jgi:hypothetical protein